MKTILQSKRMEEDKQIRESHSDTPVDPTPVDLTPNDPAQDYPTLDDPTTQDDLTPNDPAQDYPTQDDLTPNDPAQDYPTQDDLTPNDPAQDYPTQDDLTPNDPTWDDPTRDDTTWVDPWYYLKLDYLTQDVTRDDPTQEDPGDDTWYDITLDYPTQDDTWYDITLDYPTQDDTGDDTWYDITLDYPTQDDTGDNTWYDITLDYPTQDDTGDDPAGDDPAQDDPTRDDKLCDLTGDDPAQDDSTSDDSKSDDSTSDGSTSDGSISYDPTWYDPTWYDPTCDEPTCDDPTLYDPTWYDPTWYDLTEDRPTRDDTIRDDPVRDDPTPEDPTRSDPLCLPSLVVDNILDHLDDRSLLTGRLVCQSWNKNVVSRNVLWKKRCQRKRVFCFNLRTPFKDVFHQYVCFHRVYQRIMSGDAFQVDEHSEILDCFHGAREDRSLSQISGSETSKDWANDFKDLFSDYRQLWVCTDTALVLTSARVFMMVDLETPEVQWLISGVTVIFYDHFCRGIYAVTCSGEVKKYSLDGDCELEIDTGGKLQGACFMTLHSSCRFILVGLENDEVHLVDVDTRQVTILQLAFPEVLTEDDEESEGDHEEEEDEDRHLSLLFLADDSLSVGQMAICICRLYSFLVVIIDTNGKILLQASNVFRRMLCWSNSTDGSFVLKTKTRVQKYAISCTSSGIQLNLVWQKDFPARLRSEFIQIIRCGDQLMLWQRGSELLVSNLNTGQRVVHIHGFFSRYNSVSNLWRLVDVSEDSPEHIARRVQISRASQWHKPLEDRAMHVFFTNTSWLNGLSPATAKPGTPILLFTSESDTELKCLRWSKDLWSGSGLHVPGPEIWDTSLLLPENLRVNDAGFL